MRLRAYVALAGATAAVLSAEPGPSLQPQQPIRVGTSLVRVDVYPTKDGEIVSGLLPEDFEVLEDGTPQKIDTFEHVVPQKGPQTARTEPSNTRDMLAAVGNARNRVFLIFLDATHVDYRNALAINEPLTRFLREEVADDDLIGVMTAEMSASSVVFVRRTESIEQQLKTHWDWGRKGKQYAEIDTRDIQYEMCFPVIVYGDLAAKMMARRRERATFEALQDAVRYLHSVREERKAIVAISQGWPLYGPDPDMLKNDNPNARPVGLDKVRVGPNGKLTTEDPNNTVNVSRPQCDSDRARLAQIDDSRLLRDIIDDANRGNASFYTIDPSGLAVSGADRNGAMRTLAENTDGIAVLNSNDLNASWKRIARDLSSYYLLGYYSTNTKPDGRFRTITVRVRKPGVTVRARRGYRAPTAEETAAAARRVPEPAASAEVSDVTAALGRLGRIRPDARFRINAAAMTSGTGAVWVAGELQSTGGRPDEFMEGSTAIVEAASTGASTSAKVSLKPGERTFLVKLALPAGASGSLDVRARLSSDAGTSTPLTDGVRVELAPSEVQGLLFRRGPTTGNRLLPAADSRFMRTERARIEIPIGPGPRDGKPGSGRLIDRGGLTTQVPVSVGERTDEGSGQRWITADVNLAALSAGDYAIEVTFAREGGEQKVLAPIRVGR